jgi:hypothetical protein
MDKKKIVDKKIFSILNEISENQIIDIKASKIQLDKLYYSKFNPNSNINIKRFDDIILVYGIIFKQGTSKPIRFDYHVFDYLNSKKDDIISWVSKYDNYKGESTESPISTYDIFTLTVNDYNENLIIKVDANSIDTFEHDEIHPYFIRYNNFIKFINNLDKIINLINE